MQSNFPGISAELSARLNKVARAYVRVTGQCAFVELGQGNINDTFLVDRGKNSFIIQRINARVFREPRKVAQNTAVVSSHLNSNAAPAGFRFPRILQTRQGENWYVDCNGETWRAQSYIAGSRVYESIGDVALASQVGRCLAAFHHGVENLPQDRLEQVLPGFHNLPLYLQNFETALAGFSQKIRSKLHFCLECIARYGKYCDFFETAVSQGNIAAKVVHGDPKVSNVLFDVSTEKAVAMIDLDTVGSGLVLYDIGDCLRSCCGPSEERNNSEVGFDTAMAAGVLEGYLQERMLDRFELEHIYDALLLVSFELGVRFVTDYLMGNQYFKVGLPEDNLNRAVVQFQLVENIATQRRVIEGLVAGAEKQCQKR